MVVDNLAKPRRPLGDLTNSQSMPKSPVALRKLPPQAAQQNEIAFLKQIHHKNKLIELAGIELQNLRNSLMKTQQQNQSLAQANTQMLAELTRDKQRLKEVQHELSMTKGLLKMSKLELEELKKVNMPTGELPKSDKDTKLIACETGDENIIPHKSSKRGRPSRSQCEVNIPARELPMMDKETMLVGHDENNVHRKACKRGRPSTSQCEANIPTNELPKIDTETAAVALESGHDENNMPRKACKRGRTTRSQSLGVAVVPEPDTENEAIESKRLCARGESFSSSVPHKDVLETEVEKVPENKPSNDLSTKEEMVEASDGSQISDKESQRTSVGRPMRRSTAKVQSYKEKPLNVKMRRPG